MLLTSNLRIGRIVKGSGKNMLFSVLTCFAAYYINEFLISYYFNFPVFVPTVIGTALAFFIGFNNNQAYDRWWEARKIWGSLVNNSRTWARQIVQYIPDTGDSYPGIKERMVKRHIAFLYALKANLRNSKDSTFLHYLSAEDSDEAVSQQNMHNALLNIQARDLEKLYTNGYVDGFKFLELNRMITEFCDDMGRSERIKNTVFPTTYNYYSKAFIWVFIYSATMTIGNTIGIWAVVFGALLGYIFFTIQAIGQILLNPFDSIATGIPLDQITRTIEINLLQTLGEKDVPPPIESVNGEYIL